jgi:hypothetical protein
MGEQLVQFARRGKSEEAGQKRKTLIGYKEYWEGGK